MSHEGYRVLTEAVAQGVRQRQRVGYHLLQSHRLRWNVGIIGYS